MSKPQGPYSPILRAGEWLVVSGQVGVRDGALVEGGVGDEARQSLTNLKTLLESEGASMSDVVKCTVFLTDMDDFATINQIYSDAFGDHRPARSCIAVAALPFGATFEVEAWARTGEG